MNGGEKSQVRALADEVDAWRAALDQPPTADAPPPQAAPNTVTASSIASPPPTLQPSLHIGHLGACCAVYAALFVLDLFLEVSYQFDHLGRTAAIVAPLVAAWISGTSALGLRIAWRWMIARRRGSFALLFMTFAFAALLVWVALTLTSVLPREPVTLLRFPSQPAEIAYLKNVVFYFLPLITTVWLVPFHFVACLCGKLQGSQLPSALAVVERRVPFRTAADALYIPAGWLAAGMFLLGLVSVIMTQDLLRNLLPSRYTPLFMALAIAKSATYFALGLLCVAWYSRVLAGIGGDGTTF
jgi:hypothetical protein